MLDTLPYADLLAVHNALAEKPARRFDTRANGEKRTLALMEARGLTLAEAARLADVVLTDREPGEASEPPKPGETDEDRTIAAENCEADPVLTGSTPAEENDVSITVPPDIAPLVSAFSAELAKSDRPAYLATFLRRLTGERTRSIAPRERQMTASQRKIVELCSRPEGATGKELAEGCGWPSIAARATCQKLADRFGYTLEESPKANGRGISFRMVVVPAAKA